MGFWIISLAENDKIYDEIPSLLLKNKILLAISILHKSLLKSQVKEENIKSILDWNYYISETLDIFRVIYRWESKSLYYTCIFSKTKSQFIYYTCMKQNPKWDDCCTVLYHNVLCCTGLDTPLVESKTYHTTQLCPRLEL